MVSLLSIIFIKLMEMFFVSLANLVDVATECPSTAQEEEEGGPRPRAREVQNHPEEAAE